MDGQKTNGYTTYGNFDGQVTAGTGWQNADKYVTVGSAWVRVCDARSAYVGLNAAGAASPWVAAGGYVIGTQDWGSYVEVSTTLYFDQPRPPSTPAAMSISNITLTGCKLTWTAPSAPAGITNYQINRFNSAADASNNVNASYYNMGNVLTHSPNDLTPGKSYWWRLQAKGDGVWSGQSPAISGTQLDVVPEKADAPVFVSHTTTSITVSYQDPVNSGSPILERRLEIHRNGLVERKNPTSSPQTFSGLTRATEYEIIYLVRNSAGWSVQSDALHTTTDTNVPAAPTAYGVTDIASTTATSTMPTITDNGGATPNNLRVEYHTSQAAGGTITTVGSYAPAFMSGMTPGLQYYMRMAVANVKGWSDWGAWVPFTTKNNVPTPPLNLVVSAVAETQAQATWAAPADLLGSSIISYTVRVARTGWSKDYVVAPNVLTQLLDGLNPATQHYVQVWSTSNNGLGSASAIVGFVTTGVPIGQGGFSEWKKINGVWKHGTPWKNIGGVWKSGKRWKKIAGVWKSGI